MISVKGIQKIIEKKVWFKYNEAGDEAYLTGQEEAARIIHRAAQLSLNADGANAQEKLEDERFIALLESSCLD